MEITVTVERFRPKPSNDTEIWALHEQRSALIRGLISSLDLEVKGWKDTDKNGWPCEIAEIIIGLGSAGVFTAMVTAFRIWIERGKIKDVSIKCPNGKEFHLKGVTAEDVIKITRGCEVVKEGI